MSRGLYAYGTMYYGGPLSFYPGTITAVPATPYRFVKDVAIAPIVITVDDLDGGNVQMSYVSGALPPGLTLDTVLPFTGAVPYDVIISGTPTTLGLYTVTYRSATDPADLVLDFVIRNPSGDISSRLMGSALTGLFSRIR